ncbi:MAG: transglycosylase domain-containing protein [Devosia sp.]|nr:transglycosylase domain-containing protein [Devosia sp.]
MAGSTSSGSAKKRRPLLRVLRAALWLVAILVIIPLILTPIYAVVDPVSVPMLERYLTGKRVVRDWRPIEAISDRLKAAVVISEDGQFCRHWGVDLAALRDEIERLLAGKAFRGASTISMQVARNLFLSNWQSPIRKALEVPLAFYLDLVLSKRRIMEIYLNIAEWGPNGEFGVEAGTRAAFGVDAGALSWERATLLAVTLPNPLLRKPANPTRGLRRIARIVEQRTKGYGERAGCVAATGKLALE